MKWVLIMWVVWSGDLPVKQMEFYFPDEQACLDAMEQVIDRYKLIKDKKYGYTLQCGPYDSE